MAATVTTPVASDGGGAGAARFFSSLTGRYLVVSLLLAIAPLATTVVLYDRHTAELTRRLSDQKLDAALTVTANRLAAFLRTKAYQLETLAELPQLAALTARFDLAALDARARALLVAEADAPDVYAIWVLDRGDRVIGLVPGLLAAEPTTRGELQRAIATLPRVASHGAELIGPSVPEDGRPGWFLLRREIAGGAGALALQIRLASLTEHLAGAALEAYVPVLHAPGGLLLQTVGTSWAGGAPTARGAALAEGWYPAVVPAGITPPPYDAMRWTLIAAAVASGAAIAFAFARLSRRIRRRVAPLVAGAQAVARGQFDVTLPERGGDEIAQLSHAFNEMSARLRTLVQAQIENEKRALMGEFAVGIAHEVRNPLATLRTSVQALAARESEPARREMLNLMLEEIERIDGVVEGLLSFARPHRPQTGAVRCAELLRRVVALAAPLAQDARVVVALDGDTEIRLKVDPVHAQQILMNLVLNALHAMPDGGRLTLSAGRGDGVGEIMVADTGTGFGADIADKVFEPFFTTKHNGSGLGLSISRQLARINGGELTIESRAGAGTTAIVRLPLAEPGP